MFPTRFIRHERCKRLSRFDASVRGGMPFSRVHSLKYAPLFYWLKEGLYSNFKERLNRPPLIYMLIIEINISV